MQKYAFLDRDGTFLWEPEAPKGADPRNAFPPRSLEEFAFVDGAISGIRSLVDKGYKLVMVTNQPFLGTSKHPREMFDMFMQKIDEEFAHHGMKFEFKMVCPHAPDDGCNCRKPNIGGLETFLKEHEGNIDFAHSLMFGDRATDEGFAKNLGVRFVKVNTNERFVVPDDV
ncbi:MAG: HAD-IIIA family hydrolase [Parcubacteria group bacterium]|nr:HAD-IIIA family hydrolase [Parcubacteria group bacterium]